MGAGNGGSAFRYPYDIQSVLEPWREELGDDYDVVLALLADRDRALEDYTTNSHTHDGDGDNSVVVTGDAAASPADADGAGAIAIGNNAFAPADNSVAVGAGAVADGESGVAVGNQANAAFTDTVAVGGGASANDTTAVAVGPFANASGAAAVAIGDGAATSATNATAIGSSAGANEIDATAIGSDTSAAGLGATALGSNSAANAQGSTALGYDTDASHQNATAIGYNVGTTGTDQVTIGQYRLFQGTPNSAVTDSHVSTGQLSFYLEEGSDLLKGRARYSDGVTLRTFQMGTGVPVTDHDSLTGVSANDHHNQSHAIDGADHTASGLTTRHVLRATGATTFAFGAIEDADLPSTITRDTEAVLQSLADAKGDLIAASAADTWVRVPVGTNDQVLTADSAQTAGVKWADASGGSGGDGLLPYFIPFGETYTVPEFRQALFVEPIDIEGVLDVEGLLIEVTQAPDLSALLHMQTSL